MAKITSSYINVNKLKGKAENSSSVRSASRVSVYDGTKWVDKLRMTNGSNIVWDVLATTLITPDTAIRISAAGGSLLKPAVESKNSLYYIISQDKISSYSTDVFGGVRELEHTLHNRQYDKYDKANPNLNENTIGPNNSSSERSYTITARQTITGVESNISVIQEANVTSATWGNPEINDTQGFLGVRLFNHDDQDVTYVNANGTSNVGIQVYITQQKRFSSTSGETSNQTFSDWVDVVAISGDAYNGGAMNNQGFMIADSRGATTGGERAIYNIKQFTYLGFDGKQYTYNMYNTYAESITVYQQENSISYGAWTYSISASTSTTSYNAAAISTSATVTSKGTRSYTYTSGAKDGNNNTETKNFGWTASISGSGNSVNPTSASAGTTRATVTLGANTNTSSAKTSVVTFKSAGDTSKTSSITFTQSKDVVASTTIGITPHSATSVQIPASGGTATVSMTMKKTSTPLYVSGNTGTTTTTYPAATVTAIAGSAVNSSGAYVSGTGVYVKSLGTTEKTYAWNVFKISSVTGTFENKSYTYSTSFYITQGANTLSNDGNATYTFTLNESSVSVSAAKTTSKISFSSYTTQKRKWTSGSAGTSVVTNRSCTASITSGSSYATLNNTSSVSDFTLSFNANAGSSSRQVVLKITDYNGTAHNVTFTQSADTVTNKLTAVAVYSVALDPDGQIGASGASVAVRVTLKKTYTKTSVANGTSYSYSYVNASSLTINGSGTATTSGDTIKVASLGATPVSTAKTVYTISSLNWSYKDENNKTWSGTHSYSKSITQQANVATSTRYGSYTLDLTSSTTTVAATGQTVQIAVTANRIKYTKYTSGAEDSGVRENINATLSTSHGLLSASSTGSFASSATVTGGKTAYFIANANTTTSSKTLTVSAKLVDNTSTTDSISFTQSAASFEFEVKPGSGTIHYGGGSFEFSVITTINNGGFTNAPTVTSNNTAFIIDSIVFNDILMDRYTVTVRANANTSTSARSATLTFTQAGSGKKLTATISQAGKPSSGGGGGSTSNVTAEVEAYYDHSSQISYNISFSGIESYLQSCQVYVTNDPYSYDRYYGEPQYYETILPNDYLNGSITAYDFPIPSYVVVVVNNEVVGYSIVE